MKPKMKPKLMALVDGARCLGVSYFVLYRWLIIGRVRGARVGKHWFVERRDVARLLRERAKPLQRPRAPEP